MASEELLSSFNELLEEYERHRHYIERAKAQAQKFSSAVVEKVILDHEIHSTEVADKVLPIVPDLEGARTTLNSLCVACHEPERIK